MNTEILEKILSAAEGLFTEYGFRAITMDDIARKAGISKKTLYQHFANKTEVVNEAVGWNQCRFSEECMKLLRESNNAIESMVRLMAFFDNVVHSINKIALFELERFYPEAYKRFCDSIIKKDVEAIKNSINQGIKEGFFREGIDVDFSARLRVEMSFMILRPYFFSVSNQNLTKLSNGVADHFIYGILTPKGEKLYHKYKEQYIKKVTVL